MVMHQLEFDSMPPTVEAFSLSLFEGYASEPIAEATSEQAASETVMDSKVERAMKLVGPWALNSEVEVQL